MGDVTVLFQKNGLRGADEAIRLVSGHLFEELVPNALHPSVCLEGLGCVTRHVCFVQLGVQIEPEHGASTLSSLVGLPGWT